MTNSISSKIFVFFFALTLMCAGVLTINKNDEVVEASTTIQSSVSNSTPDYFSAVDSGDSGMIDSDIFMYSSTDENTLTLSFINNGSGTSTSGIYGFVFYPDTNDTTTFQFFSSGSASLSINGVNQTITSKTFFESTTYYFPNQVDSQSQSFVYLETFNMVFDNSGTASNAISLFDNGELIEGLYEVTLTYLLSTCTDGGSTLAEESFTDQTYTFTYSFYVVSQDSYFDNGRPVIENSEFDKTISISATSDSSAYYLYSNYTSDEDVGTATDKNKVPYIEYDPTRYDLAISKNLNSTISTYTLEYDTSGEVVASDEDLLFSYDGDALKLYFVDLGIYTITFTAIQVVEIDETVVKLPLDGITNSSKNIVVYMYGYQLGFTDFDKDRDENNSRQITEMKSVDTSGETYSFTDSADITSSFIASESEYSQANYGDTFLNYNVIEYVNSASDPVTTNQKPVRFTTNATLVSSLSYIFTTKQISGYTESQYYLGSSKLYYKNFTGTTESTDATYIYIVAYTYNYYYASEGTLTTNQVFYQVFYFEINSTNPEITVKTVDTSSESVLSNKYYNTSIYVNDDTKEEDPYCKDVTVQIYAWDYSSNSYFSIFGGSSGVALADILGNTASGYYDTYQSESYAVQLDANAYYTIRLFYTSDLTSGKTTTAISNTSGYISSMSFYIDKNEISGLEARNATQSSSASSYQILTSFETITNQSFVLSWNNKDSGASISAYYRYFPLVETSFYPLSSTSTASTLISTMLNLSNGELIAVDSVLDLSGTGSTSWLPLASSTGTGGNTNSYSDFSYISTDYVLSNAGLYLIQLEDEAGNVAYAVYMIEDTTPYFVIQDTTETYGYSISSSVQYVKNTSTLYWGEYKAIYVKGLTAGLLTTTNTITTDDLDSADNKIYYDRYGNSCIELYEIFKEFYNESLLQNVSNENVSASEVSSLGYISSYSSIYLTIAIDPVTYYTTTGTYSSQGSSINPITSVTFNIDNYDDGLTYSVLIRDASNTQQDFTNTSTLRQYEYYYSAKQTIVISFDSSELQITYQDNSDESQTLVSYTSQTTTDTDGVKSKTSYFHPSSLEKAFSVSFIPTIEDDDSLIQVKSVTIYYYAYETTSYYDATSGVTYYYTTLSSTASEIPIYEFNSNNGQTTAISTEINVSTDGYTSPGKYVITREYYLDEADNRYIYSEKDVFSLSLVLYVDRFDVISSPETVSSGTTESLVGGDIFVSMFDGGSTADIVVTFPNSDQGNTDGQTLFNSATSSSSVKTSLTTNKLPVKFYVPVYKFTKYVKQVQDATGYHYAVVSDLDMNSFYESDGEYENIKEYVLYAEIYNGDTSNPKNLIAATSTDLETAISDYSSNNGFLVFYSKNSVYSETTGITTAGTYYVVVHQGYFGEEHSSDNAFDQSITFKIVIEAATPDFVARTTTETLNSESSDGSVSEIYYTNQSKIVLSWDASTDDYKVQIDLNAIQVTAVKANGTSTTYSTAITSGEANSLTDLWESAPTLSSNGSTYTATLNLETLGVYEDSAYIDITMQFENHSTYYKTVSKRVCVDLVSPYTNINTLLSNTLKANETVSIGRLTESNLRTYQNASGQTVSSYANASYNFSNSSSDGYFSYYSYQVDSSFISSLQSSASKEALTSSNGNLQYLTYIKEVSDKYTSSSTTAQESTPSNFNSNDGYSVVGGSDTTSYATALNTNTYYEVVECDKAGNKTIYTIYVADKTSTDQTLLSATSITTDDDGNYDTDTREYTSAEYIQAEKDGTTKTFYLRTGYQLSTINYFGDQWAIIRLTTYGSNNSSTTRTLVLSPTQSGYAYQVSGSSMTLVSISSLIDSSLSTTNRHIMEIYDRTTGDWDAIYIGVYNTTLSATLSSNSSEESITFYQPSDTMLTSSTAKSTVFLKGLKITITLSSSASTILVYGTQDGDDTEYITNLTGLASNWKGTDDQIVSVSTSTNSLKFTLNLSSYGVGTKVKYYFIDNYGREYIETHIYGETVISQPVTTTDSNLYSYINSSGETVYIAQTNMSYSYNATRNTVVVYNTKTSEALATGTTTYYDSNDIGYKITISTSTSSGVTTTKVLATATTDGTTGYQNANYDLQLSFLVFDAETYDSETSTAETCDKQVLFRLYDELPLPTTSSSLSTGQFRVIDSNTNDITSEILGLTDASNGGYYSEVRVLFSLDSAIDIPVIFSISTDGVNWEELTSGTRLRNTTSEMITYYLKIWYQEDCLENTYGSIWSYVFQNVPDEQIFKFNLSSLTATYWVEKTVDGVTEIVQKSGSTFEYNGNKYSNHYTVNVEFSSTAADEDSPVCIRVNQEYGLEVTSLSTIVQNGVTSEILKVASTEDSTYNLTFTVVISFIPPSDSFVTTFHMSGLSGTLEDTNYITTTSNSVYVTEEYASLDTIKLQWTKYYGIKENPVSIYITKEDGSVLNPTLYSTSDSNGDYYYTYITYSGKFTIMLKDSAGNIQKFGSSSRSSEVFSLTFLKDVPFNLAYTDLDGNEVTTLPTSQATFNSSVTLTIPSTLISLFYGYPSISVTLNGETYNGEFASTATSYTFSEAGYYEVTLSASLSTGELLRSETYQFSIVSSDEYKISYVLNKYSNYYIESIVKDDSDVTSLMLATLDTDTLSANGSEHLASLSLSYLDEKTGNGVYVITVNSNSSLYDETSDVLTSWTYQITINQGTAPIKISISEGSSTTSNITIQYNAQNMFAELGNCFIRVMKSNENTSSLSLAGDETEITSESTGDRTITITGTGTYFVQVVSASGNLLFTYKVTKNEAMNAATIIIIVIGVVLAIVVLFLVFRLRKRISVK